MIDISEYENDKDYLEALDKLNILCESGIVYPWKLL